MDEERTAKSSPVIPLAAPTSPGGAPPLQEGEVQPTGRVHPEIQADIERISVGPHIIITISPEGGDHVALKRHSIGEWKGEQILKALGLIQRDMKAVLKQLTGAEL